MRLAVVATAICLSITGLAAAADAEAAIKQPTHIPPQGLGTALQLLTRERNLQLVYRSEVVRDLHTGGAAGDLTALEALSEILAGTGLTYRYLDDNTVTIIPIPGSPASYSGPAPGENVTGRGDPQQQDAQGKNLQGAFRLAQASSGGGAQAVAAEAQPVQLEEIVVTAQKREERLQDVPIPVTAISAATLLDSNQFRIQDYATLIPGLSAPLEGPLQVLSIRGVTTGRNTNPTVGVTVDDVPFGASTNLGNGGGLMPDIDPADLARVEVLRGPQGTLYGASSMGGLLKFVTVDPSTDGVSGHAQVGGSQVHNGPDLGYNASAALNMPLGSDLAVRASGFSRRTPGYIDDIATGQRGVNQEDADGGHLALLWKPSEDLSLKLGALVQHTNWDGQNDVLLGPGLGDLQQNFVRGTGAQSTSLQDYSAVLKARVWDLNLTAISGYNTSSYSSVADLTTVYGTVYTQPLFGVTGSPFVNDDRSNKFTQEIRLSGELGPRLDWLLGGFYTHESSQFSQGILASDTNTGAVVGTVLHVSLPSIYREYAAFTDLTFHLTDRFDVQIGGRESHIEEVNLTSIETGGLLGGATSITPQANANANVFTYLVTPQYKVSSDLMVYARLASGYRPGGPNPSASTFGYPAQYGPDKTQNYEIGTKEDFFGRTLSLDASLYYIDWRDIQLDLLTPTKIAYLANGNDAKSQGLELSVESRPVTGLTATAWVAFNEAVLTEGFPLSSSAYGIAGDRLPYSSRFTANASLQQTFPLGHHLAGFVAGSVSYVGNREGEFTSSSQRQIFGAYAKTDLRAGASYAAWKASLFLNNATDKRAILNNGGGILPQDFQIIQPRTVGIQLEYRFE